MDKDSSWQDYYLEVVKEGLQPKFPQDQELEIGSQSIGEGYVQYWAYPKSSHRKAHQLPYAEGIASLHPTDQPAILIDQPQDSSKTDLLELVLTFNGHAWAKLTTNTENLEDNLKGILEFAGKSYNMKVEHFMTTDRVADRVQRKLDSIEGDQGEETEQELDSQEADDTDQKVSDPDDTAKTTRQPSLASIKSVGSSIKNPSWPSSGIYSSGGKSSAGLLGAILTLLVLAAFTVGVYLFKDQISTKLGLSRGSSTSTITPSTEDVVISPTVVPTLTPIPTINRSIYQVRVLNGTSKSGAAATLADKLKELGWEIGKVGNATSSAIPKTFVKVKSGDDTVFQQLAQDLSLPKDSTISGTLSKADQADAEVVIGKD